MLREVSFEYALRASLIGCQILVGGATPLEQIDRGEDLFIFERWPREEARYCYNMLRWSRWQYAHDHGEPAHFFICVKHFRGY